MKSSKPTSGRSRKCRVPSGFQGRAQLRRARLPQRWRTPRRAGARTQVGDPAPRRDELGTAAREVQPSRATLEAMGVERGDRVVAYMPNVPEAVVAFLATASMGQSGRAALRTSAREHRGPLQADRAEGPLRRGRLPLRRRDYCWDAGRGEAASGDPPSKTVVLLTSATNRTSTPSRTPCWDELPDPTRARSSGSSRCPSTTRLWVLYPRGPQWLPKAIVPARAAS